MLDKTVNNSRSTRRNHVIEVSFERPDRDGSNGGKNVEIGGEMGEL